MIERRIPLLVASASLLFGAGCSGSAGDVVADAAGSSDRDTADGSFDGADSGRPDRPEPDAGLDTSQPDVTIQDTGGSEVIDEDTEGGDAADAGADGDAVDVADARADTAADVADDTAADTGVDTPDVDADASTDAADTGTDASDAGVDTDAGDGGTGGALFDEIATLRNDMCDRMYACNPEAFAEYYDGVSECAGDPNLLRRFLDNHDEACGQALRDAIECVVTSGECAEYDGYTYPYLDAYEACSEQYYAYYDACLYDAPFSCTDGYEIPGHWVCDGWDDCAESEDEADCDVFDCYADSPIPSSYVCDGIDDCYYGDDEVGCGT